MVLGGPQESDGKSIARARLTISCTYDKLGATEYGSRSGKLTVCRMGLVLKILNRLDAKASGTRTLGLDPDRFDVSSVEAVATALRRVAGFLCPCPQRVLVEAVVRPLEELVDDKEELLEVVEDTLEAMLGYGDLLDELEVA